MKRIEYIAVLLLSIVVFSACDDESGKERGLELSPALPALDLTAEKATQTFILHSGFPAWHIELSYGEDTEWIDVWPTEGDYDGRFSVTVAANPTGYVRNSVLSVRAGKRTVYSLPIRQAGCGFSLAVNVPDNRKTVSAGAQDLEIVVTATGTWCAEVTKGGDWLSPGKSSPTRQHLSIRENGTGMQREGVVHFAIPGTDAVLDLYITQTAN